MGADPALEEQFGPYLVYERLGVGGMATVHRALERGIEGFERIVALKRLLPHLAEDASFIKSFVREAKLASILHHNNIVQIFELGRVGTEYFISMEYIDGRDIRRILRHARKVTGPPPIHITVGLLLQLCDALDYAHSKVDDEGHPLGLVHRDVSPSNLLVTTAGHLKVIDFGIAKAQSSQLRTQTGRVKGKLAYMAPEAITGKELDARSDLFAAGVIAHELLTARPLFASKNEYQTLLKVQRGDIMPPSTFNQGCPAELDAIVLRALARDPDERFADASELRDVLLETRRKYNLQTGHRDVAQWIQWAFSLEAPSGGFAVQNTLDQTGSAFDVSGKLHSSVNTPTPRPRREDDDAVEIAWGGGDEASSVPLELEDVPDVSDKHLGAAPRFDVDDLGDDIPAPQPSHGIQRPVRDTSPQPVVPAARDTAPQPVVPAARGTAPLPVVPAARDTAPQQVVPAARDTAPQQVVRARDTTPQRVVPTEAPASERPASRPTPPPIPVRSTGTQPVVRVSASVPVQRPSEPPRRITAQGNAVQPIVDRPSRPESTDELEGAAPRHARSLSQLSALPSPTHEDSHDPERSQSGLRSRPSSAPSLEIDLTESATATQPRQKRPSNVQIGANIVARESVRSKAWVVVLLVVVVGAGLTAGALYMSRDKKVVAAAVPEPGVPVKPQGTLKFVIEPSDVEIGVLGQKHVGSPWSIQVEPGIHQIQIHREGYKARLMSIELSPNETQTLVVTLERLTSEAVAEANLILSSTPTGLEVVIDGKLQAQRTPMKTPLGVGSHTIVLRQNGVEVWRHQLVAQANVDHEFNPSMAEEKKRERQQRTSLTDARKEPPPPTPVPQEKTVVEDDKPAPEKPTPSPLPPTPVAPVPPPPPPPAPTPAPPSKPVPIAIPSAGPHTVAPNAVSRLSGETVTLGKSKRAEVPPVVAAKVCIDSHGAVSSVQLLTKLERHTISDLSATLRTWRYTPYKHDGVAAPACFAVSFKVK